MTSFTFPVLWLPGRRISVQVCAGPMVTFARLLPSDNFEHDGADLGSEFVPHLRHPRSLGTAACMCRSFATGGV